ncbi:hypothetical protein EI94DRAFT_1801798 [Lactarius quietus]|nr:hypothetical protein EI94DRAFT_1801798 [Lactarius quietus]
MPPSTNPATAFPTTGTADLLSQMPSLPVPPQNSQGPPFYPPPGPPPQYGYPAPGGSQYHAAVVGMNVPQAQPYYRAPPYPPFNHHGWGYGPYSPPAFPGPVPQPGVPQPTCDVPHQVEQTQGHAEVGQMLATKQPVPTTFSPKKKTPNEQVSEGARTDMQWGEFKDHVVMRFDEVDVCLNCRLNVDTQAWSDLSCKADFTDAMVRVADRAAVGRTRDVCLEVKNVIRKARAPAKGKCTWAEDVPSQTPVDMVGDVNHLRELQDRLLCATHSKSGIRTYCWIELAEEGIKGGHHEFSHNELMLWAKYIAHGLATMSCPPNIKKLDYPPTKKPRWRSLPPNSILQ